jgi:hypothetical protein
MSPRLVVLMIVLCLSLPFLAQANGILYTFSTDLYGGGNPQPPPPGSTIYWQFEVPSILTTPTTIASFISASLGPGFGDCTIGSVQLPLPGAFPGFSGNLVTNFVSPCGGFDGANANFVLPITSLGVFDDISRFNGKVRGTLTISAAPEPSAIFLLGTGLLTLVGFALLKSTYSWNRHIEGDPVVAFTQHSNEMLQRVPQGFLFRRAFR